jgi:hypothetical protein
MIPIEDLRETTCWGTGPARSRGGAIIDWNRKPGRDPQIVLADRGGPKENC